MYLVKNKKSIFYQIIYFVDGKRTTHSTKRVYKKEAAKYLREFKKSLEHPKDTKPPEIQISIIKNTFLLSEFKGEYLEYVKSVKSKSYYRSISYAFNYFISFCGDIPLNRIDTRIVDKFINSTFRRTQRGAHQYYRTLKAALTKAVEWDYISINPFTKVKFPKLSKSFPAFIPEDQFLLILANTETQQLRDIFTTAFYTGLRLGELVNMRWNWIDFLQNQITVKCTDNFLTKSKKERIVPMSEKVRSILYNRFNSANHSLDEVVFYNRRNKKLHQDELSKKFKIVIRRSNLNEKIHFHSLRHSFASLLVQRGVSLFVVKELLGHEDLATTQIYAHLQQQNLRDAVNLL